MDILFGIIMWGIIAFFIGFVIYMLFKIVDKKQGGK